MNEAIGIVVKLATMSELELVTARDTTDNQTFKDIIQNVIHVRFPVSKIEICETNPQEPTGLEVCDDESYDPRLDDSDKSDELRELEEYHPDRE